MTGSTTPMLAPIDQRPEGRADWAALAPYWDLYEEGGLAQNIEILHETLTSPILILGGGQGHLEELLAERGHRTMSVDRCAEMARYAKQRRGIETLVADIAGLDLRRRFRTVVASTGVFDAAVVRGDATVDPILAAIHRHMYPHSRAVFGYFRPSQFGLALRELGMTRQPSTVGLFWPPAPRHVVRSRFIDAGVPSATAWRHFTMFPLEFDVMGEHFATVAQRYQADGGTDPAEFLSRYAGFGAGELTAGDRQRLMQRCEAAGLDIEDDILFPGAVAAMLVKRRDGPTNKRD